MTTDTETLLTIPEVAAMLRKTPKWMRKNAKRFGGFKMGRDWNFHRCDVDAALAWMRGNAMPRRIIASSVSRQSIPKPSRSWF